MRKLGYTVSNGGPYKTIKKRIKELNIDISHMSHYGARLVEQMASNQTV